MVGTLLICGFGFFSVGVIIPAITLAFLVSLLTLLRSFKNLFLNLLLLLFVGFGIYISMLILNKETSILERLQLFSFFLNGDGHIIFDKTTSYIYSFFIWILIKLFQYKFLTINFFPFWVDKEDLEHTIESHINDVPSRSLYLCECIFYAPMIWGCGLFFIVLCFAVKGVKFIGKFLFNTICGK